LIFLCGAIPTLATTVLALYRPAFLSRLDNVAYDTLLRWAPAKPPGGRVVIVDVDERSLSTIGQWPWRRDLMARLIAHLRDMGASTVALDIVFAEPDRFDRVASLDEESRLGTSATPDAVLADTLRDGRVVLGYALRFDTASNAAARCVLHPLSVSIIQPRHDIDGAPLFHASDVVCNLPMLAQAAAASGFLNAAPDSDGILRRVPLVIELDGQVYPGLALAAVAAATGLRGAALQVLNANAASLILDNWTVPLDGKSNLLLRYRGKKKTFPYVSAADVLDRHVPSGTFRDKIVFIGTTALGTREVVATPFDTLFAGVEVQATIADNLLQRDFIGRHELGPSFESLATLTLGLTVALFVATTPALWGLLTGAGSATMLWWGAAWLLWTKGVFVSPLFPTIALVAALALMTLATSTLEGRRAETAGKEKTAAQRLMVQSLLSLTEMRDAETGRHSRRTQQYAKLLAEQLATHPRFRNSLTPERIDLLSSLAPLHDIGKVGVPDRILNKRGALDPEELAEMRKHPVYGRDVILKAEREVGARDEEILRVAKDIVYTHHERWDGTGYPAGLRGEQIPVEGRVMALVDVYDAAATRNVYRQPIPHDKVVDFIVAAKGTHFDPAVVDAFVRVADDFKNVSHEPEST